MKQQHSFKIVLASIVIALTASCSQVLETPNYGFYQDKEILKTEADANGLINGAYSELTRQNWKLYHNVFWIVVDEDNDHVTGPGWVLQGTTGTGNFPGFWGMNNVWSGLYQTISRANQVLEKVPAMSIDETVKNNVLAEAQALRGWAYFTLVQMYGPLPLRTKSLDADPTTVKVPRSAISDVYKLIVSDLTTAIPNLLPKGDSKGGGIGRISKPAAMAILAKVYLTMASGSQKGVSISVRGGADNTVRKYTQNGVAGYESFTSADYFKKSLELSDAIIKGNGGGSFDLLNYDDAFKRANNNGAESLWYLQFKAGTLVI